MWNWLKSYFQFCGRAVKDNFKRSRWYVHMKAISWLISTVLSVIGVLYIIRKLYPLLSGATWAIIGLSVFIVFLLFIIENVRRFHFRIVSELNIQHRAASGLFHKHSDITARLNYHSGEACQMILDCQTRKETLSENEINSWTERVVQYMKEYKLYDYVSKFADPKLPNQLPELLPLDPDKLRKARLDARLDLLREFARELRNQAINSPYGSDSDPNTLTSSR